MTHVDLPKQTNACVMVLNGQNNAFMKGMKPRSTKMWVLQNKSDGFVKGEPPWNTIWYPKMLILFGKSDDLWEGCRRGWSCVFTGGGEMYINTQNVSFAE